LILNGVKILCFDTLLEVLNLKVLRLHKNYAKWSSSPPFL
jgi:hypothetical protein